VTVPLSVAFSGLSTGLMITSYGVEAGSRAAGKGADTIRRKRTAKEPSSPRKKWESRWGGGVAKSRIGISTRAAMLAELENELGQVSDNFFKPTFVKETIFEQYLGEDILEAIKKNQHKRKTAKKKRAFDLSDERLLYEKELYFLAEGFVESPARITRDEISDVLMGKVTSPPKKRTLWKKLHGGGAYQDWVVKLETDDFFDQGNYQSGEEAA